ncbi:MAG TPA: Nif3-like dinuclear metal center hexameric protein [Puia sp.]|nr:Nif3-like dinuclear metal center hexameric protein [Puia sp.]
MPGPPLDKNSSGYTWRRRDFLTAALATVAGSSLLTIPHAAAGAATAEDRLGGGSLQGDAVRPDGVVPQEGGEITVRQVIDLILADIPGAPFSQTVDTIKAGNIDQPVKGIVTTMFATDAVIEKAIGLGANFIIAHEPTFYNHADETDWLKEDSVFLFKKDLLDSHGIVVWRFHDYWHAHRPDGILVGVLTALGWEKFYNAAEPPIITVPAISLGEVVKRAKKQLGIDKMKVMGDLSQSCQRIVLSPGAAGGGAQIGELRKYSPDLLIVGELNEWETSEYIRDARYQGLKMSLLVLGHSVSEEPGMQWLIPLLQPKVPGIKISHVPSGDPFMWV